MRRGPQTSILALALLALVSSPADAGKKQQDGYVDPLELYRIAKKSRTSYSIDLESAVEGVSSDAFADLLWPTVQEALEAPWVELDAEGGRRLVAYPLDAGCLEALGQAEPLFDAKDYSGALTHYLAAVAEYPRCYMAFSHAGDCHYFRKDYPAALTWYDKALALNPFDYRTQFYLGNARSRVGDAPGALEAYAQSLTLKPRNPNLLAALRVHAESLGVTPDEWTFRPRALARREGEKVGVYAPGEQAHWVVYGLCKGVWIGEPQHRKRRTGDAERRWTSTEERECILAMLDNYDARREDDSVPTDPQLDRLMAILEAGLLDEFVLYEIGSRVAPQVMLLLDDATRAGVTEYVRRFVLGRSAGADDAGESTHAGRK